MRISSPVQAVLTAIKTPNRWDLLVIPTVFGFFFLLAWGSRQMSASYNLGEPISIFLDPSNLPVYALRTTLRMALAMMCSILFTFFYASLAVRNRRAEQILIPLLDVLQSVPILGFLSITTMWFVHLFSGSLLGPEAAAVFAIFTSQAWNMTFSFYHSLRMIPKELYHVAQVFQLSWWQRFWKLEVPFAMPNLVWNAMMSVSGGWFFVVASEAITVDGQNIMLPGIGSYIAVAIAERNLPAIGYAIAAMLIVIILYDQLIFRPIVAWSEKFKFELSEGSDIPDSWVLTAIQRTQLFRKLLAIPVRVWEYTLEVSRSFAFKPGAILSGKERRKEESLIPDRTWEILMACIAVSSVIFLARFVLSEADYGEIGRVFLLGLATATRVIILIILASLIWVPVGVWIGQRPAFARRAQPIVLFLSAFPANLLFPLAVSFIALYQLNPEIWVSPLMILGTQWYILFNVIAGAASIPNDMREAAANLGLKGWMLWKRLILPAVFPAYVTGGLTASGGAWNASVVSEVVTWGTTTFSASGIGAYIAEQTKAGDHPRVALGIVVMSLYVMLLNRFFWNRLYRYAEERLALE
jgi:NitT/TauT family transport system permease protein